MAILSTIYNLVSCGTSAVLGTGTKGCTQFLKKATSIWITQKGFKYDGTSTLDETYAQLEQAKGNLIILKGVKSFADNSSDDTIETLEDGTKQVATLGMYEFTATFINGLAFHAALHSLSSFGSYDITFVDRDGNLLGTKASDGSLKGFSVGMLQGGRLSFPTDAVGQKESIMFQFLVRKELDTNYVYIQQAQLGTFQPQNLDGINEVVLSMAIPADAATSLVVTAKSKQNQNAWVGGLTGDFQIKRDGVVESQTVAESPAGTYTFTVAAIAADEVWTIGLYDTANVRDIILQDVDLYKSNIDSKIAV
jgi:hypothetical protein